MIGERDELKKQISCRVTEKEFDEFWKMCHHQYTSMAAVTRSLVLSWMEKNRKKK